MVPHAEPNIPELYSADEWRVAYADAISTYKENLSTFGLNTGRIVLQSALKRLGYAGKLLENEIAYIVGK